ncbi:MAG: hydroxyacid dehydrogenase [Actinomycetota bacterium]
MTDDLDASPDPPTGLPVVHVDRPPTSDDVAVAAGRARLVGPDDDALAGVAATVIGVGRRWDADRFARFPDLRVVSRMGIGYDNVDVEAARASGVTVCYAPDAPTVSTAEHTMALLLAVTKELPQQHDRVRRGEWGNPSPTALELDGAILGLVGCGRIGRRVARAASALGMRVVAFDPAAPADVGVPDPDGVEYVDLDAVIETSDVISLHAPATPATRHLVGTDSLGRMKRGVYLVNCARGPLVDEAALVEALDTGRVAGAGLDVTDPEPPDRDAPILHHPRVIVTGHVASSTTSGRRRLFEHALDNALAVLAGEPASVVP